VIYYKDGAKMMRPVLSREEYLRLRDGGEQKSNLRRIRQGEVKLKGELVQMNYSCLPNDDGTLRGSKTASTTVGMDVDFNAPESFSAEEQKGWLKEQMAKVPELVLGKKEALGLLMLERSATKGYHLAFRRRPELSQEENLKWASELLGVKYDKGAKDITRVFYSTTAEAEELLYLDDEIFEVAALQCFSSDFGTDYTASKEDTAFEADQTTPDPSYSGGETGRVSQDESRVNPCQEQHSAEATAQTLAAFDLCAEQAGLKVGEMDVWGEHNWHANLMAVLSVGVAKLMNRAQLMSVIAVRLPNYSQTEDCRKLVDYFYEKYDADKGFMNASLREINAKAQSMPPKLGGDRGLNGGIDFDFSDDGSDPQPPNLGGLIAKRLPQGVKDSVEAVGQELAMPTVTAICPCIGALATGVKLDVHGDKRGLNLIAYIAGEFASGKGKIDPVVDAWMAEERTLNKMYEMQEEEWISKKQAAKNKKEQPEELKLPWRYITLNNTVANLAQRLANTAGKHAFSFTPEADTVAEKWKSDMCNFSVMLRQAYDGSRYDREAKSADAVRVHIEHLLWNVTMCGTPDALYRVVRNYTDGFQSRIAVARTPDNTYSRLEDKVPVLTTRQTERIGQIAHLLPLMQGDVTLPKLEAKGREWLERIRMETMKNDDKTKARQRFRICVTAQRMTCCLMLCKVCEQLIQKHGLNGAETLLKQKPTLWKEMLLKTQTAQMLEVYDVIADSLMDNALFFFRDRIEKAVNSRDYAGGGDRLRIGKNDTIYERLDQQFTFAQAMQQSVIEKGAGVTQNSVKQMLKNWKKQGLITQAEAGRYHKT
jgi:hypothetical protein